MVQSQSRLWDPPYPRKRRFPINRLDLESKSKCPRTFYYFFYIIYQKQRGKKILAHTLGWNWKSSCEVNTNNIVFCCVFFPYATMYTHKACYIVWIPFYTSLVYICPSWWRKFYPSFFFKYRYLLTTKQFVKSCLLIFVQANLIVCCISCRSN